MQPTIRFKKIHAPSFEAGAIDEGVGFLPKELLYKFVTSGSGYSDFLYVPPGTYLEEAVLFIEEALDTGALLDVGTDGDDDCIIDNTDVTEDAVGVMDSSTTLLAGMYFEDGDTLRLTVTNDTDQGVVWLLLRLYNFLEMKSQGQHNTVTIGA